MANGSRQPGFKSGFFSSIMLAGMLWD